MKKHLLFIVSLIFILSACSAAPQKLAEKTLTLRTKTGNEVSVLAEMALTQTEQAKGYMERRFIPEGTGMLFVFKSSRFLSFWMKNTPTPLSIAYIDGNGKICDILDMKPYDLTPVVSSEPCIYALEVPQGWFKRAGISVGDYLVLDF